MSKPALLLALHVASSLVGGGTETAQASGATGAAHELVRFAERSTERGTRLDRVTLGGLAELAEDCRFEEAKVRELAPERREELRDFVKLFCKPWERWWDGVFRPCDGERVPGWCRDEELVFKRLDFLGYLDLLVASIESAEDPLLRYNLTSLLTTSFLPHVVTELPQQPIEERASSGLRAFLMEASPEDAVEVAEALQSTWLGLPAGAAAQLRAFAGRTGVDEKSRARLLLIAGSRYAPESTSTGP